MKESDFTSARRTTERHLVAPDEQIKASEDGCPILPLVQYACLVEYPNRVRCSPFLRLFKQCDGHSIEVTPALGSRPDLDADGVRVGRVVVPASALDDWKYQQQRKYAIIN